MIEFVNVVNLKRRFDKLIGYYGMMLSRSVPFDVIVPFQAYDAADYEDGFAVRDEVIKDFSFWKKIPDEWFGYRGRGSMCCMWSFQSVLRKIADGNAFQLFTTDHYCIKWNWWDLNVFVSKLPEFDIFQMEHWGSEKEGNLPPHFPDPIEGFPNISRGLAGPGDAVLLLSPKGASRILDWWSENPVLLLEQLLHIFSKDNPSGCISPVVSRDFVWGSLMLESLTGKINSERTAIR